MKKNIYLLYLACATVCLFSCSDSKIKIKNSLAEQNLKGNVKTLIFYSYRAITKSEFGNEVLALNSTEHYVESIKKLESITIKDIEKDSLISKTVSMFNKEGNEEERKIYNANGLLKIHFVFVYDAKGHAIETKTNLKNGDLYSIYKYEYDGNKQIQKIYNPDASFKQKIVHNFDNNGNDVEDITFDNSSSSPTERCTYQYTSTGNLIEYTHFKGDVLDGKTLFKHDNKGNKTKYFYCQEDYDNDDKPDTWDPSQPPPPPPLYEKPVFKYTDFDKLGNWLKVFEFYSYTPKFINEREIEYY